MKNFGPFLYNLRRNADLSLEELAKLVDSSRSSLSRFENNDVPMPFKGTACTLVIRLAEILCTSKQEIKRYIELAEIDLSILLEAEQIQIGAAPAITGNTPEDLPSLEHTKAIYQDLIARLEMTKARLGKNTLASIEMRMQEYTKGLQSVQKRIDDIIHQQEQRNRQSTDLIHMPQEILQEGAKETDIITVSPHDEVQQPTLQNTIQHPRQDSALMLLTEYEKKLLASLFALDGDLLTETPDGSSAVKSRRHLLRQALTLIGASLALPLDLDPMPLAEPKHDIISDTLITFFENTMATQWELYHTGGAIRVVQSLDPWIKEIARLSRLTQDTNWHARILKLLTMSYQLQSCVLRDIMDYKQAHIAYQRAFHIAQELEDAELMGAALAREGVTLIQQDKPKQAILYLDGALTTIEGHTFPKLKGHILQALSEAHAKAHQEQECWSAIGQAESIQEEPVQEYSLIRMNKASLAAQKGVNAVLLGDYQQAIRLLDASLTTYDPALIRGRARLLAQKAEAYYGLGAIEACITTAREAVTLGYSAGSSKTIARVRTLHNHLEQSSWRKEPGITHLGEMLARG